MRDITLDDGTIVDLKVAREDDYDYGRYEYLYAWLCKVDQFLAKQYKLEDLIGNKAQWLQSLENNKVTLLSLYKDNIIGSATLILNEPHSRASHVASFGVVVHPDFQRKGLGKQLIAALEQIARDQGIKKIEVNFYDGNPAAAMYKSLDYDFEGRRLKKARLNDGTYVDEILLSKFIDIF
jgi:L-phenylalanine/L-methionine N-acetyltransferase